MMSVPDICPGRRLTPTLLNVFFHLVGMEGLEPSCPFGRRILSPPCIPIPAHPGFVVEMTGIEPMPLDLQSSALEQNARPNYATSPLLLRTRPDLNQRHEDLQSPALPTELRVHNLSSIIYCLLQACFVLTSLNPYLHLALILRQESLSGSVSLYMKFRLDLPSTPLYWVRDLNP